MEEKVRKLTLNQVKDEIKTLENVFPVVRLLQADEVRAEVSDCPARSTNAKCYDIWKRKKPCGNCISYRALTEKKQFSKLERLDGKVYQVISAYVEADGKPCVIEMVKPFDENMPVDFGDDESNHIKISEYYEKTYTDVLTGAYNRRYYEENLANLTLTGGVAMIDLDDFKIYNDLFGHAAGDAVLKAVAAVIKKCVRHTDKLVRYGGDEFLLVFSGINGEVLSRCLADINRQVKLTVIDEYPAIKPSISSGGISCVDELVKNAVKRADEFLYRAKKHKDCWVTESSKVEFLDKLRSHERVLVVDDSDINREILTTILKNEYEVEEAASGSECIAAIKRYGADISVILLDLVMPGMSGFDVLDYMNDNHIIENIPVITITGDESDDSMRAAYEKGVSDYITRPFDARVVYRRVANTVNLYARQKRLIREIMHETSEKEKGETLLIEILSQVVEFGDGECMGNGSHARHMLNFTRLILEKLAEKTDKYNLNRREIELISTASALHDIGKAAIDRKIVNKKGKLTAVEYEIMKTHTVIGEEMLDNVVGYKDEPLVKCAKEICRMHHERYDGKGYPDGLKGDEIPVSAQVVSICDVYDALISKRSYKPAYSHEVALNMIKNGECGVFNPLIVQCLDEISDKLKEIADGEKTAKN